MRARSTSIVAGIAAIAAGTLLAGSPAAAATLPDGQRITIYDNVPGDFGQAYETSPVDATSTPVGAQQVPWFIQGIDVDEHGLGYAVEWRNGDSSEAWLWQADANTGVLSNPVQVLSDEPGDTISTCFGIDLQPDGSILLACNGDSGQAAGSWIGTVSTDGTFTPLVTGNDDTVPLVLWTALAYDAVTDQLWGFGQLQGVDSAYLVDLGSNSLGDGILLTQPVYGADFDRDGQLFVTTQSGENPISLGTAVATSGVVSAIAVITSEEEPLLDPISLTVWGASTTPVNPVLPVTGTADLLPVGLGTALLFLAGAAFVVTNRIQRRAV